MNSEDKTKYYAFFDVDGTVINLNSLMSFLRYYYESTALLRTIGTVRFMLAKGRLYVYRRYMGKNRNFLNRFYYKFFKNQPAVKIRECAKEWFSELDHKHKGLYREGVVEQLHKHQAKGAEIVFVSGSFPDCLQPLADKFNVKHILAITIEQQNGVYTGNILPPQTIGEGKRVAMEKFLQIKNDSQASDCYAYGDHVSDIPMLAVVGNSVAIAGDPSLTAYARNNGWQIMKNT